MGWGVALRFIASYLVDDTGSIHLGHAGESLPPGDLGDDEVVAVKERGLVEWLAREGHVRIRLRPSLVSAAAHARLMAWLAASRPERVLLSWYATGEWHYEYLRGAMPAGERLSALIEQHGGARAVNLCRRPLPLTAFPSERVDEALAFWREHRDTFRGPEAMRVLGRLLNDRWILYRRFTPGGFAVEGFSEHHAGHVNRWLARDGRLESSGESFTARACTPVYRDVADQFSPGCDELDAVSCWAGYGRKRSRFRRLMLPFRSGPTIWVAAAIRLDPDIDLLD